MARANVISFLLITWLIGKQKEREENFFSITLMPIISFLAMRIIFFEWKEDITPKFDWIHIHHPFINVLFLFNFKIICHSYYIIEIGKVNIHHHLAYFIDTYSHVIVWVGLYPAFLAPISKESNTDKERKKTH